MGKKIIKGAEKLDLSELKTMLYAAENHQYPIYPAEGPCGGCDLILAPNDVAEGPCGGCDLIKPKTVAEGPCGGCDVLKKK